MKINPDLDDRTLDKTRLVELDIHAAVRAGGAGRLRDS